MPLAFMSMIFCSGGVNVVVAPGDPLRRAANGPPGREAGVKARHDQERERAEPEDPQFGRDLEPHVVGHAPARDHHVAVVIHELARADRR